MPHFIIECSENVIQQKSPDDVMQAVYDVAEATGLFAANDTKVRLRPYQYFKLGEGKKDFIHIFGNIMEGRSTEQKANLSRKVVERLNEMFPDISILSINIREFEKATSRKLQHEQPRNSFSCCKMGCNPKYTTAASTHTGCYANANGPRLLDDTTP